MTPVNVILRQDMGKYAIYSKRLEGCAVLVMKGFRSGERGRRRFCT